MSIDTLCDWGERMQPTPLQLQVGRVYPFWIATRVLLISFLTNLLSDPHSVHLFVMAFRT
ncbi:hypothetical protein D6U27_01020, partial [Vibrio cholerae]|nr:hypothetical protein [Vibrio cholerae]